MGSNPNRPETVAMIVIRCETGKEVSVDSESLVGANLRGLDLHRALLDGQCGLRKFLPANSGNYCRLS
jgi:hypothetical protein